MSVAIFGRRRFKEDALVTALRHVDTLQLSALPRMADFARWVAAATAGSRLPWSMDRFLAAYKRNADEAIGIAADADTVGTAIQSLLNSQKTFSGTATQLLSLLDNRMPLPLRGRDWPTAANHLSDRVRRLAPVLRNKGFVVDLSKPRQIYLSRKTT